jgi:hypothetical protein
MSFSRNFSLLGNERTKFRILSLHSRGWELLCGSLLAIGKFGPLSRTYGEAIATLGAIAVIASFLFFTAATPWPGIAAVLPCVGTAAIIWAGEGNTLPIVSRLLGTSAAVGVGKISYPLYLWHWPVLVAFRIEIFREPTAAEAGALILLSVVLAVATVILIEAPVRSKRVLSTRRQLLLLSAVMLLVCYISGRFTYTHQGFPLRFSAESLANSGWADPQISWKIRWYDGYQRYCEGGHFDAIASGSVCRFGTEAGGKSPDFALWGDSHAEAILPAMNLMAQRYGVTGQIFFHHSCTPLLSIGEAGTTAIISIELSPRAYKYNGFRMFFSSHSGHHPINRRCQLSAPQKATNLRAENLKQIARRKQRSQTH